MLEPPMPAMKDNDETAWSSEALAPPPHFEGDGTPINENAPRPERIKALSPL